MTIHASNCARDEASPPRSCDRRALRDALGTFPTGVTIVTTRTASGRYVGLTCNSFSSLSLSPPLILWSLLKTSSSLPAFAGAEYFGISILSQAQQALSVKFASRTERFENVELISGHGGVPLIAGAAAYFECANGGRFDGGDHIIFLGRILGFSHTDKPPLVFHMGGYSALIDTSD